MSINRTNANYNPQRFSPPYRPVAKRFVNSTRQELALTYRAVPYLIDYALSIWAERKRDAEYAIYQIMTRFNPLAEWVVESEFGRSVVQAHFQGFVDSSDVDTPAEEVAKVRYDINIQVEGFLPLPERIVPTILGRVGVIRDVRGNFLENIKFGEAE